MEAFIILLNRALPYNSTGIVGGMSGAHYGTSYYEAAYAAHVCRMPLEQWRACRADVTAGVHRPMCRWEVDVELPESPVVEDGMLGRIRDATPDQLDAIVSGLQNPLVQAVYQKIRFAGVPVPPLAIAPPEVPPAPPAALPVPVAVEQPSPGQHTLESLKGIQYLKLLKIAREAGVENPERLDTSEAVRLAIIDRQASAPAPVAAVAATPAGPYFDVQPPITEAQAHNLNVTR